MRIQSPERRVLRVAAVVMLVLALAPTAAGYLSTGGSSGFPLQDVGDDAADRQYAGPRENVTVVTTQGPDHVIEGPIEEPQSLIVAFDPDGTLLYHNTTRDNYFDVDPVRGTRTTVIYSAADYLPSNRCDRSGQCFRVVVERTNLSTGTVEVLHRRTVPIVTDRYGRWSPGRWHDVDVESDGDLLIGKIQTDSVEVVDPSTGVAEWQWDAQEAFPLAGGGSFPFDWTHLNDVERLPDGRIMVSLRNQDKVVFVDPESGVQENWTIGAEDDHDVLYEQHNPDYIPAARGGPSVIVADSQNDRIVEYQRTDGEWERTWTWTDDDMAWPRDADRLPNGHTLITDSTADRVIEVSENGSIVWSVSLHNPYDAERLGTGDESAGGASAQRLGLSDRTGGDESGDEGGSVGTAERIKSSVVGLLPTKIKNGLIAIVPAWLSFWAIVGLFVAGLTVVAWVGAELRYAGRSVELRVPVRLR